MAKYYTVGQLAKLYQISTDSLRYYETLGLLSPRRAANGYRQYCTADIWRLNVIRDLRAMDFSMDHIRAYFASHTIDSALALLMEEQRAVDTRIQELSRLRENLVRRREALLAVQNHPVGKVHVQSFPKRACHVIQKGYSTDEEMDILIKQLVNFDAEHLFIIGNNEIGSLVNLEQVEQGRFRRYDGVFIMHPQGERIFPAGQYLTLYYRGKCDQNSRYIPLLFDYAQKHDLHTGSILIEMLCTDIHTSALPQEQLTQLQLLLHEDTTVKGNGLAH